MKIINNILYIIIGMLISTIIIFIYDQNNNGENVIWSCNNKYGVYKCKGKLIKICEIGE